MLMLPALVEIVKQWQNAATEMNSYVFGGSDDAITALTNVMADGKMWETAVTQITGDEIQALCETAML